MCGRRHRNPTFPLPVATCSQPFINQRHGITQNRLVVMTEISSARAATASQLPTHHTYRSMHHHNPLSHRSERIDLSNIPHSIKTMILEQSTAKLSGYQSSKVFVRTDLKYSTLDTKQLLTEKKKHVEEVYKSGFCSDPKELYRPLGEPIIDTETLLYKRLDVDPSVRDSKNAYMFLDEYKEEAFHKLNAKNERKFREAPRRHTNGFKYIKEKLSKSHLKVNSVKFGVPFMSVCELDDREHTYDKKDEPVDPDAIAKVDWNHLEIDPDRQAFFTNVMLRHERSLNANTRTDADGEGEDNVDEGGHGRGDRSHKTHANGKEKKKSKRKDDGTPLVYGKSQQIKLAPKQIEVMLDIRRPHPAVDTTEKFFTARDDFYEQRQRLTHLLLDDLNRLDYERKSSFERKARIFELSNKAQCIDDMTSMRQKATELRRKDKKAILDAHPWYSELINKVVVMNGVRREVTHYELLLLGRLKRLIEDQVLFSKKVFVQLMRVLPTREFNKDEIQRIIRFVKQHESISERDILDAVEQAGHGIS